MREKKLPNFFSFINYRILWRWKVKFSKDLIEDTGEGAEREAQLSDQIADSEPKTSSLSLSLSLNYIQSL